MKKVGKIISILIISIIIGFSSYSCSRKNMFNDKIPMPFNVGLAVVMSGSMEPELSVDDLIVVKKQKEYRVNDVVMYQKNGSLIVHRIIDISFDGVITTQGDFNNTPDESITIKNIKGKVIYSVPKVGLIISFVTSPLGVLIIIVVMIGLYLLCNREKDDELDQMKKELEELKK
ncbi:MAG: signal peptidase I [Erysipelotrichaceae bacterium]|nr:signal peptidase I [Erysipelotrichaceae bacterium]